MKMALESAIVFALRWKENAAIIAKNSPF